RAHARFRRTQAGTDWITKEHVTLQSPLEATLRGPCGAPFLAFRRVCRPVNSQYGHDLAAVQVPLEPARIGRATPFASGTPAGRWELWLDPLAAVGAEQMQFCTRRHGADAFADAGRLCTRDAYDHLARRQFAGIGGNRLGVALPRAVDEGLGADFLDRLHDKIERDAAAGIIGDHEIFGPDSQDAGVADIAELRLEFVRAHRQQIHRRRADERSDEGGRGLLVDRQRIADLLDL